jgi:hypothetical protein
MIVKNMIDDPVGRDPHPAGPLEERGDRLPQRGNARRGHVMRLAREERLDRRLADVVRRREVRLADLQVDDPLPGRLKRLRPRQHLER